MGRVERWEPLMLLATASALGYIDEAELSKTDCGKELVRNPKTGKLVQRRNLPADVRKTEMAKCKEKKKSWKGHDDEVRKDKVAAAGKKTVDDHSADLQKKMQTDPDFRRRALAAFGGK